MERKRLVINHVMRRYPVPPTLDMVYETFHMLSCSYTLTVAIVLYVKIFIRPDVYWVN